MSGILGIWHLDGRPVDGLLVASLSKLLAYRGPDGEGRWLNGSVGFAFQNLWVTKESVGETQPLVYPNECAVLFDGRLDNRDDLLGDLKGDYQVSGNSSDAVLVSALYRKFGEAFVEKLNGDFAVAVYDIRQHALFLARDPIGVRPLYFAKAGETFLVASEVKPILAHPAIAPRPNGDMLAAALLSCFGQERQGWTFFEGVSSVLPGQLVAVTRKRITKRIYWDFRTPEPLRFASFRQYAEAFRHYFEQAVARRLRSAFPVAVSLSGGVDSSSVYCTAKTLQRRHSGLCPNVVPISMEIEASQANEGAFLDDIERQYETPIHRIPCVVRYATGSVYKGFRDVEVPYFRGPLDSTYTFARTVGAIGARVQLTGQWGDQLLADRTYLIDFARRLRWSAVCHHLVGHSKKSSLPLRWSAQWFLKDLVREHVPARIWRLLRHTRGRLVSKRNWYTDEFWNRSRAAEVLQQFRPPGQTAYQRSVYRSLRCMYYAQALEWCNKIGAVNGFEWSFPFFDRDLVSFLLAIPGDIVCFKGVPKALLRTAMQGILPATIAERRWKAHITDELRVAMDRQFLDFSRYLDCDIMAVKLGYVDEHRLKTLLPAIKRRLSNGDYRVMSQLADLFGLEIWLQSFFGMKLDNNGKEETLA